MVFGVVAKNYLDILVIQRWYPTETVFPNSLALHLNDLKSLAFATLALKSVASSFE